MRVIPTSRVPTDFGFLCMPQLPCFGGRRRGAKATPFYALDESIPITLALVRADRKSVV